MSSDPFAFHLLIKYRNIWDLETFPDTIRHQIRQAHFAWHASL